jgi:hypothetical protein
MKNENITILVDNQEKGFSSIPDAVTYAFETSKSYYFENGRSPNFAIRKGDETVLKFHFKQVITLETIVTS